MKERLITLLLFFLLQGGTSLSSDIQRPIKVLIVGDTFKNCSIHVLDLAVGISHHGHSVDLYFFCGRGDKKLLNQGLSIYISKWPPDLKHYDIIYCLSGIAGKRLIKLRAININNKTTKLAVRLTGPDIINGQNFTHDYQELFSLGNLFLADCEYVKYKALLLGCDPKKIIVHHMGIKQERYPFRICLLRPNDTVSLVSICPLKEINGIENVICALKEVVSKYPNKKIHYTIIGDGPKREQIKKKIDELNLKPIITLIGSLSEQSIQKVLDKSHILLLPCVTTVGGVQKGIPDIIKVAMAKGVIVVSTRHGGIPEIIENDVSGFLVPERFASRMGYWVRHLIRHRQKWPKIILRAKEKVISDFDLRKTSQRLIEIFNRII